MSVEARVRRRSEERDDVLDTGCRSRFRRSVGKPKVDYADLKRLAQFLGEEDIVGLDVAMNDAMRMDMLQSRQLKDVLSTMSLCRVLTRTN